jgi:hypothetical protein
MKGYEPQTISKRPTPVSKCFTVERQTRKRENENIRQTTHYTCSNIYCINNYSIYFFLKILKSETDFTKSFSMVIL